MSGPTLLETLQKKFGDKVVGANLEALDPWIEVSPAGLVEVCRYLRDDNDWRLDMLNCITVVDYFDHRSEEGGEGGLGAAFRGRLSPFEHRQEAYAGAEGQDCRGGRTSRRRNCRKCPRVSGVWRTADWHERETYDLSGVWFTGHPDLRRILCPEDWVGHPLRKDYEMPLEYHGIRGR